jgi:hypothetical protein
MKKVQRTLWKKVTSATLPVVVNAAAAGPVVKRKLG